MSVLANAFWRPSRLLELTGWILVVAMVALLVVQFTGWTTSRLVAASHSATPYVLAAALPLAAVALVTQRWWLAGGFGVVVAGFVVLSWPLLAPPGQPAVADGGAEVRVFHGNIYYGNDELPALIAKLEQLDDVDVLAFTEYTDAQGEAFAASALADRYPYRIEHTRDRGGSAVWSRFPLDESLAPALDSPSTLVRVAAPDPFALYVIHATSPLTDLDEWRNELRLLTDDPFGTGSRERDPDLPVLMVGDFNASFWHPEFRDLLGADWTDAHQALHRGFSTSWPTDRRFVPTLVRLDHALLDDGLVATNIDDLRLPGSDHLGFVVAVAPAA